MNKTYLTDNFRLAYIFNIGFYFCICLSSVLLLTFTEKYIGDFENSQWDSDNIIIAIIFTSLQFCILYSQLFLKQSIKTVRNITKILGLFLFLGIVISFFGAIVYDYGIAGKFSTYKYGFIFKIIPVDILIYFYIYSKKKYYNSVPYITITFYILLKLITGWTGNILYLAIFLISININYIFKRKISYLILLLPALVAPIYAAKLYFRKDYYGFNQFTSLSLPEMYIHAISEYIGRVSVFQNNFMVTSNINYIVDISKEYITDYWYIYEFLGGLIPKGYFSLKIYTLENFIPLLVGKQLDYGVSYITGIIGKIIFAFNINQTSGYFLIIFFMVILYFIYKFLSYSTGSANKFLFIFLLTPVLISGHIVELANIFYGCMFYSVLYFFYTFDSSTN